MSTSREILNFNTGWRFIDEDLGEARKRDFDDSGFEDICLPHSNRTYRHHYFTEERYRFISWYRRPFYLDKAFEGRTIVVEFEGVMTVATVFVNGQLICEHKGGYTGFACDVTHAVTFGGQNVIAVKVDSRCREDVPPEGRNVDYMQFG
ncbi:beta-galactosidase, partial [Candidatus Bipolaricaulota bacterium]|nr:beta-galactosidase [Candidatus Bipolaricaulota bacterium]